MTEKLRVTLAPGARVTLDPHPSGFPGLAPLVLEAGDTMLVDPAEAERLFQDGRVLNLVTGKPIPRRHDPREGRVTVQYGTGPVQDATALGVVHPNYAALAEQKAPEPPRSGVPRGTVQYPGQFAGGAFLSGGSATILGGDDDFGPGF